MTSATRPAGDWATLLKTIADEQGACVARLRQLTAGYLAAQSGLPGWTRGHVLAHLAGNARAHARQLVHAARGQLVPMYEGGNDARAAAIEVSAQQGLAPLVDELSAAHAAVLRAAQGFTTSTSSARVAYRQGTVHDLMQARLMELHLHQVDLALPGHDASSIPATAARSIIYFLASRIPQGQRWHLVAPEYSVWIGTGQPIELRGDAGSLACYLGGRPHSSLAVDGQPLPLQAWPDRESSIAELQFDEA